MREENKANKKRSLSEAQEKVEQDKMETEVKIMKAS